MEDYVYTFLWKMAEHGEEEKPFPAILTGELKWNNGITYVFVKGALAVDGEEITAEHIDFTEGLWQQIQDNIKKYFEGQDIVGWVFGEKLLSLEPSEVFVKAHMKHFGCDKILMLMDSGEKEEAFFRYDNSFMVRQKGFYIYYEKNPQMQNYMVENIPELYKNDMEEVEDEAVHSFRKLIQKKDRDKKQETEEKTSVFSYAATACLVLAMVAAGGRFYQNYQKMQKSDVRTEETVGKVAEITEVTEKITATPVPPTTKPPTPTPVPEVSVTEDNETKENVFREEADTRKAEKRVRETETAAFSNTYVIKPGDTLYQISVANYGTIDKVSEICRLNGITEDQIIYPGQIIVLP